MAAAMNGGQSPQEQAYRDQQRFYRTQQQQLTRIENDLEYMRLQQQHEATTRWMNNNRR
jgi:hypothetical protein